MHLHILKDLLIFLTISIIAVNIMKITSESLLKQNTNQKIGSGLTTYLRIKYSERQEI